ncbi:hypothetical protein Golomagni_07303 [Golovinomyces magnicellulatus]|nr:hypothetical protein Golomagni_07303 [Golovinomyces magnicellulatus]
MKEMQQTSLRLASANGPVTRTILKTPLRDALPSEIPIIDVADIYSDSLDARKAVAAKVHQASTTMGFFYISNHGIDDKIPQATYESSLDFFQQDISTKMEAITAKSKCDNGYQPNNTQRVNADEGVDFRESFFYMYDKRLDSIHGPDDVVPAIAKENLGQEDFVAESTKSVPAFEKSLRVHFIECLKLARALTRTFALSLGLAEDYFDSKCLYPDASFTVNYYPAVDEPHRDTETEVGIGSHTDFALFTILWQDQIGGLQVLNSDGQWIRATPIKGTFVVNIADFMQRITNDLYVSTVHRAQNWSGRERISVPFFWGFGMHERCGVVESCVRKGEKAKIGSRNAWSTCSWWIRLEE